MWKAVSIVGWCLALLLTILWLRETQKQPQLLALSQEQAVDGAAAEQAANQRSSETTSLEDQLRVLTAKLDAAEAQILELRAEQVRVFTDRLDNAKAQVLGLRAEERRLVKRAEDAEELTKGDSLIGLETVDGTARQIVDSQYADLLGQLNLDDETMRAVADIIGQAYAHMSKQGMEWLAGGGGQLPLGEAAYAQWMSNELSYILSPEDLAVFDQYQAQLPGGMLGAQMEVQLANFSAELTAESIYAIADTLAAVMSSGSWLLSDGGTFTMMGMVDGMYGQARERLAGYLSNQQLTIYDSFVAQQLWGIRMWRGMMN